MALFPNPERAKPPATIPQVLEPVRDDLERVGAQYRAILADASGPSADLVHHAARFDGKRLRPALTCVAARLAGGGVTEDVATVAAIVELIHTATLVHDDILDSAELRRRVTTLNSRWGDQAAVLAGDVLFSKAYRAAAYLSDPFASRYLADAVGRVLDGEIHQDLVAHDTELTEAEYRGIIGGKTAALYEAALTVGAHYGGGDAPLIACLARYGQRLGMAFQIVDDRLDLTGDEATVGKSLGTDLTEGKMTLPVILWLDAQEEAEKHAARKLIREAWSDEEAALELRVRLKTSGALRRADDAAAAEIEEALDAIEALPSCVESKVLTSVARFVLRRRN